MVAVALGWLTWVRLPALAVVGALTYPLYLLHQSNGQTVIRLLRPHLPPWLLLSCLVTALLIVSYGVHMLIERPVVGRAMRRGLQASFAQMRAGGREPMARHALAAKSSAPVPRSGGPHHLADRADDVAGVPPSTLDT